MFDGLSDPSGPLVTDTGGETVASDVLRAHLNEHEQPRHAVLSDSVEHETEGRTTTVQPEGDHDAYLIVTDERVFVILGDQPDTVEIAFDLVTITKSRLKSGLLSTTLVIGHSDETIRFSPTDGDAETVAEYISLMAEVYRSVESSIGSATDILETLESQIREEGTEGDLPLRVRSQLSEARHHATHEEDIPTDRLLTRVDEAEAELDRRYVQAWLDRGETELEIAEDALADDDFDEACAAYTTTAAALSSVRDVLADIDDVPDAVLADVESLADRTDQVGETYVEATQQSYEAATEAADSQAAATAWIETYRRLSAARAADWNDLDRTATLPVDELESVAAETVDALEAHATSLEDEGDTTLEEDAERAREYFEEATDWIGQAQDIATEWEGIAETDYAARLEHLEEQIEVTEWQWGSE